MCDFLPRDWIVVKGLRQAKINTCILSSHSYIIHQPSSYLPLLQPQCTQAIYPCGRRRHLQTPHAPCSLHKFVSSYMAKLVGSCRQLLYLNKQANKTYLIMLCCLYWDYGFFFIAIQKSACVDEPLKNIFHIHGPHSRALTPPCQSAQCRYCFLWENPTHLNCSFKTKVVTIPYGKEFPH